MSSFEGDTLILPCVAVGSVAQLAADVLLGPGSPFEEAKHVMDLDSSCCVPFVGGSVGGRSRALITPLQVYRDANSRVTIVQQRSPPFKARKDDFVARLAAWAKQSRFQQVLVLSSVDAALRGDGELQTGLRFVQRTNRQGTTLSLRFADKVTSLDSLTSTRSLPGSGVARRLMASLERAEVPASLLAVYCAEGDNRADAKAMAMHVYKAVDPSGRPWTEVREPEEWTMVFGSGPDQSLFN